MANKKISELPAAGAITGPELVEIVKGGVNNQTTAQDIANLAAGGVSSVNGDTGVVVLNAADVGADPAGTGAAAAAALLTTTITNGDTTHAPDGNAVFDALAAEVVARDAAIAAALSAAKSMVISVTDEVTNIGTGTGKVSFRMPYAMTLTAVRASLVVAQASGSIFTVDINEGGTTILSTKLTIDNTETTSVSAATQPVISDAALADDAVITVDVDQIGNGSAIGLKITLIGT